MDAWTPTPELIDAEFSPTVTVPPCVNIEDMLWGFFKVAEWRFEHHLRDYRNWQIAAARSAAYEAVADGKVVWH